jgi:hypothetical protein
VSAGRGVGSEHLLQQIQQERRLCTILVQEFVEKLSEVAKSLHEGSSRRLFVSFKMDVLETQVEVQYGFPASLL